MKIFTFMAKRHLLYSIVVDNAANMVRAVKNFSDIAELNDDENVLISAEGDMSEEYIPDPELMMTDWLKNADMPVQFMRCGIHTLQLAVWAGLNTREAKIQLKSIRQAVVKLRTPTFRNLLMKRYGLTQILETVTRWGSTFMMLDRFLKFKDFCEEAATTGTVELHLEESEWDNIKTIRNILEKPYLTTLKLQSANLTPGEFFKEWYCLKKFLAEQNGVIALEMSAAMNVREQNIFCNTHFLAAVYADPRYRILLTTQQQLSGKEGLFNIRVRLLKLMTLANSCNNASTQSLIQNSTDISLNSSSTDDEFERELDIQEKQQRAISSSFATEDLLKSKFLTCCEAVENLGRFKVKDVFEAFGKYPGDIQLSCQIASSMPTSQVSVERLFSALKLIMSDLRYSLKDDLLRAILFYRFNCSE